MTNDIRRIAAEAGEAIMKTYDGPAEVETKDDDSPLTQADRAAHDCIVAALAITEIIVLQCPRPLPIWQ